MSTGRAASAPRGASSPATSAEVTGREAALGHRAAAVATAAALAAGAALRIWQYAGGASLSLDELALARNVVDRPLGSLLVERLAYGQVAPRGFLLLEKLAVLLLGGSEYALRLVPLSCAIASLALFALVARRVLSGAAVPFAVALLALATPLIDYGAQVKQYSGDVTAALAITLLALTWTPAADARRRLLVGLAGFVLVWLSQPAVFVLTGAAVALVAAALQERDRRALRALLPVLALWGAGVLAAVGVGLASATPTTRAYLRDYWWVGFVPVPRTLDDALWGWRAARAVFAVPLLGYPFATPYVVLATAGAWSLWRQRRVAAAILLAPVLVTLVAAGLRQYPFADRLVLFLLPAALLLVAEGVEWVRTRWPMRLRAVGALSVALLALPPAAALLRNPPVYRPEEVRPALAYIRAHRRPGEPVYVYYGAWQAVGYYGARYGLEDSAVIGGGCHRGDPRAYLRELDRLRGAPRVWLLFVHALAPLGERESMLRYLDRIGARRAAVELAPRPSESPTVAAYLYDLSDPVRLGGAAAETAPLAIAPFHVSVGDGCVVGPQVPVVADAAGGGTPLFLSR
ncbi:MAG: hypothetical protein ACJ79S_08195 [Gemmatimonadaceae bacterium]